MTTPDADARIRGKTVRLIWNDGPQKGKSYDHVFHEDGTVEWQDAGAGKPSANPRPSDTPKERPKYAALKAGDDACAVSYLAASGYTLTAVLDFRTGTMVGFASGAKEWYPLRGRFEVLA